MPFNDKIAGIILGTMFLCGGIGMLFALPEHWPWYRKVIFEFAMFGASLLCFMMGFFGIKTPGPDD